MLRNAFWLLFAFAAAVVLALLLRHNHGSVSIFWPPYRIDLASNMVMVLAVIGFFILHLLLIGLAKLIGLPERIRALRERRRVRRANAALQGASLAWFEGRFEKAERLASQAVDEPVTAPTAALIAARAAHRLGHRQRRDDWVRRLGQVEPGQAASVLAEAEFALDDRQPQRALAAVERLRVASVDPRLALTTAIATWRQFGRWEQVLEVVRTQKGKSSRLEPIEIDALRLQAYEGLLAPHKEDAAGILECWRALRNDERKRRDLTVPTVLALLRVGEAEEARKILTPILDREYDDTLVECYGAMESIPGRTRLEQLERWRNRYGDRPRLLEMLGRVCASERLWGKAETYLLQSVAASDSVSARVALAQLYDEINRRGDASTQFQAAARLALGERPGLALQLDSARAQGRPAIPGGRAVTTVPRDASSVAALPGAAAAAGALATDDDTELAASLPHPIPAPEANDVAPAPAGGAGERTGAATGGKNAKGTKGAKDAKGARNAKGAADARDVKELGRAGLGDGEKGKTGEPAGAAGSASAVAGVAELSEAGASGDSPSRAADAGEAADAVAAAVSSDSGHPGASAPGAAASAMVSDTSASDALASDMSVVASDAPATLVAPSVSEPASTAPQTSSLPQTTSGGAASAEPASPEARGRSTRRSTSDDS